jgi:hypothetical protein
MFKDVARVQLWNTLGKVGQLPCCEGLR